MQYNAIMSRALENCQKTDVYSRRSQTKICEYKKLEKVKARRTSTVDD